MKNVHVCFVFDGKESKYVRFADLLVRSLRLYVPDWPITCGVVEGDHVPPMWDGVEFFKIIPPDEEIRYANKVELLRLLSPREDRVLFLDTDVLVLRRPEFPDVTKDLVAVHMDWASQCTNEKVFRDTYRALGVQFPKERIPCTMYGPDLPPIVNAGMLLFQSRVLPEFTEHWLRNFHALKTAEWAGRNKGFTEQTVILPTLAKLGMTYQLLDADWNWNGTIWPSRPNKTVFLHYHRADVLDTDPEALRVRREIGDLI